MDFSAIFNRQGKFKTFCLIICAQQYDRVIHFYLFSH